MTDANAVRPPASEFPDGFQWFNTDRPLRFDGDLKGQVVVLDFWTYCCINCIHILPHLARLEEEFAHEPVVVIGSHSAKFHNESIPAHIRSAILRYAMTHPVVVDEGMRIWKDYGARGWPTLVYIDAEGRVAGKVSGEQSFDQIKGVVVRLLKEGREKGTLAAAAPVLAREQSTPAPSGLAFPGKVLAHPQSDSLLIADSNHHRILHADRAGNVRAIYGQSASGFKDGAAEDARFANPQGMAIDPAGRVLFVADTDNHALREINLATGVVRTLAGTGRQVFDRKGGRVGVQQGLNSPWDLALDSGTGLLFIAMAGGHQIWTYDRKTGIAANRAGSGLENITDGPLGAAAFAQPSGLCFDASGRLIVADSEVSAIRMIDWRAGRVHSLIGRGLHVFGDTDGPWQKARLQHPLGVAVDERPGRGEIYVADAYNHKIKRLIRAEQRIETILGRTRSAEDDGPTLPAPDVLYEPGGISCADGVLYIADTNHHRILAYDLDRGAVREVVIRGLAGPSPVTDALPISIENRRRLAPVRPGASVVLHLCPALGESEKLAPGAPVSITVHPINGNRGEGERQTVVADSPASMGEGSWIYRFSASDDIQTSLYAVTLDVTVCTSGDGAMCRPMTWTWQIEVKTEKDGASERIVNLCDAAPTAIR